MSRSIPFVLALFAPGVSQAFCGTYVGSPGDDLYNQSSQVVIARDGFNTHLTLANDYSGTASDFAMVIPVPALLGPEDVSIVDAGVLTRIDAYSAPRLVSYTCDELHPDYYYGNSYGYGYGNDDYDRSGGYSYEGGSESKGCGPNKSRIHADTDLAFDASDADTDADADSDADTDADVPLTPDAIDTVEVEAEFAVGQYELVVLSAEESEGLLLWLNLSGYSIPGETEALLTEYIESGSYFIAAKVSLEALAGESQYLSPIRLSYPSQFISLPIRLGALNSPGSQNLTVFAINDASLGKMGISNHLEVTVEDECMYDATKFESFGEFYRERLKAAMKVESQVGVWTTEYSWQPTKCDPCTDDGPLSDIDARALGYSAGATNAHFTRLLVRYTPQQANQDLVMYHSNSSSQEQARYIAYRDDLGGDFPVCGDGWTAPGTCDSPPVPAADTVESKPQRHGRAGLLFLGLAFLLPLRRRLG